MLSMVFNCQCAWPAATWTSHMNTDMLHSHQAWCWPWIRRCSSMARHKCHKCHKLLNAAKNVATCRGLALALLVLLVHVHWDHAKACATGHVEHPTLGESFAARLTWCWWLVRAAVHGVREVRRWWLMPWALLNLRRGTRVSSNWHSNCSRQFQV